MSDQEKSSEQVKKPKSFWKSIWKFLNSNFGLWVLSTCVVGALSFAYKEYKDNEAEAGEKKERELLAANRNATLVSVLLPYLASDEEKQWRLAMAVTTYLRQNGELPLELESALIGIVQTSSKASGSTAEVEKVNAAAMVIDTPPDDTTKRTKKTIGLSLLPPRVYIQISSESQRADAKVLQGKLADSSFISPGIENASNKAQFPEVAEVRYFVESERNEAERVARILRNVVPDANSRPLFVKLKNKNRPRHYEVWFSK